MNKEEQVGYLANIYHLLLSEGTVDRVEEKAFEQISRDIGAGYFERKNAMDLARQQGYQPQMASRWSERIGNLEDMLFAAYCNGVLDPEEKQAIRDYAGRLGINREQFDVIKQETKRRYQQYKAKIR